MKYIGNFWQSVPEELITEILNYTIPVSEIEEEKEKRSRFAKLWNRKTDEISLDHIDWNKIKTKPILPKFFDEILEIWYTKYMPGDMLPFHTDDFDFDSTDISRYVMMLQDMKLGHVFMYDNEILNNYRAGDVFEYPNRDIWHGACNMGFEPRMTMQIVSRHKK